MLIMQRKLGLGITTDIREVALTWNGPDGTNVTAKNDAETSTYGSDINMMGGEVMFAKATAAGETFLPPTIKILMSGAVSGTDTFNLSTATLNSASSPGSNMLLTGIFKSMVQLNISHIGLTNFPAVNISGGGYTIYSGVFNIGEQRNLSGTLDPTPGILVSGMATFASSIDIWDGSNNTTIDISGLTSAGQSTSSGDWLLQAAEFI